MSNVTVLQILGHKEEDVIAKLGEVHQQFYLVSFQGNETVEEVLNKLAGRKIISGPVNCNGKMLMVDLFDIAAAIADASGNQTLENVLKQPVSNLCNYMNKVPLCTMDLAESGSNLLKNLADPSIRRVLITRENDPIGFLSEMDAIRWMVKNFDVLSQNLRQTPVQSLMSTNPGSIEESEKLMNAIKMCVQKQYHGVPVIQNGKLVANISVSDLREMQPKDVSNFFNLTVGQFLKSTKKDLIKTPVTASPNTSLFEVMKLMFQNHIHRVHILDANQKLIGVVTSCDVLNKICQEQGN
jgi:CBS domain-containing protein